jgi:hypothetical protein
VGESKAPEERAYCYNVGVERMLLKWVLENNGKSGHHACGPESELMVAFSENCNKTWGSINCGEFDENLYSFWNTNSGPSPKTPEITAVGLCC